MKPKITLAGVDIGEEFAPQVFVEIGINHEGDLAVAKEMASSAIKAGARFIKHQTHMPDFEMSKEAESTIPGNSDVSIYEVMSRCALTESDERELAQHVRGLGGIFFSTPFCREAVDRLESFEVPFYKIGSGECNNFPFVDYVASTGKPIVLSTGMNSLESVSTAVSILEKRGVQYALLHTTNLYPTPSRLLRLGGLNDLSQNFEVPFGLSDHSVSNAACLGAIALGASIVERHFVDSKSRPGPDVVCSMDNDELVQLLEWGYQLFQARGGQKGLSDEEKVTANFAFASVSSTKDINVGDVLTKDNCFPVRPGNGAFGPSDYDTVLGSIASRFIQARTQIKPEMLRSPNGEVGANQN
jgi:N-acetylneuraminate synthase